MTQTHNFPLRTTHFIVFGLLLAGLLAGGLIATAEDSPQVTGPACAAQLETFYTIASEVCIGGADGYACNGGTAPNAEPAGPVNNSLATTGAMVPVDALESLNTMPINSDGSGGGLVWMRIPETQTDALIIGDVTVRDVPVEGFPAWQSTIVETFNDEQTCAAAPRSTFVLQNKEVMQPGRIVVNGVSLGIAGTVMVQTRGTETVFITLDGQLRVNAGGQIQNLMAGQQVSVPYNEEDFSRPIAGPSQPAPFEVGLVQNFPVALLDRPTLLPEPGFVSTRGVVNMRSSPSTNAGLIFEIPAGVTMTVLGRNPEGDWYHVRLADGQTGWMFAELLQQNHAGINNVYSATPVPPQRYGDVGELARVNAPNGVNMRTAPYPTFGVMHNLAPAEEVRLVARSPYSPWVKVDASGTVGWVALITLETQAIIDSLPIDFDVPPPPQPTQIPGIWGGAFPDPDCYPNC